MAYPTRLSASSDLRKDIERIRSAVRFHTRYTEDVRQCENLLANFVGENGAKPGIDPVVTRSMALFRRIKDAVKLHFTDLEQRLARWKPDEFGILSSNEIKLAEDLIRIAILGGRDFDLFLRHLNIEFVTIVYLGVGEKGILDVNEQMSKVLATIQKAETELSSLMSSRECHHIQQALQALSLPC